MQFLPQNFIPLNHEGLLKKAEENSASFEGQKDSKLISKIPLIHRTTSENAIKILESGGILPYNQIQHKKNRSSQEKLITELTNNTDILDKKLGFDNYAFFSYGKTAVSDNPKDDVFFCFDSEKIGKIPGTIIAEKEIAELNAIVSKFGALHHEKYNNFNIKDLSNRNHKATIDFYEKIMLWESFEKYFPELFKKHSYLLLDYLAYELSHPDDKISINQNGKIQGYWQGFQFMIPKKIGLENITGIMCGENTDFKKIKKVANRKGLRATNRSEIISNIEKHININDLGIPNDLLLNNIFLTLLHNNQIKVKNIIQGLHNLNTPHNQW